MRINLVGGSMFVAFLSGAAAVHCGTTSFTVVDGGADATTDAPKVSDAKGDVSSSTSYLDGGPDSACVAPHVCGGNGENACCANNGKQVTGFCSPTVTCPGEGDASAPPHKLCAGPADCANNYTNSVNLGETCCVIAQDPVLPIGFCTTASLCASFGGARICTGKADCLTTDCVEESCVGSSASAMLKVCDEPSFCGSGTGSGTGTSMSSTSAHSSSTSSGSSSNTAGSSASTCIPLGASAGNQDDCCSQALSNGKCCIPSGTAAMGAPASECCADHASDAGTCCVATGANDTGDPQECCTGAARAGDAGANANLCCIPYGPNGGSAMNCCTPDLGGVATGNCCIMTGNDMGSKNNCCSMMANGTTCVAPTI
jgi:hypothetical protein